MAKIYLPTQLRELTDGISPIEVDGNTIRVIIASLEERFPGLGPRLSTGDSLVPGIGVSVDGAMSSRGLYTPVKPDSEVHFHPAIGGG
jgi:sulfur-carrier protein